MMSLKNHTLKKLIETLIGYNYKELYLEYRNVAQDKAAGRKYSPINDPILSSKVDFDYNRINLNNVPPKWIKVWNMIHYPEEKNENTTNKRSYEETRRNEH